MSFIGVTHNDQKLPTFLEPIPFAERYSCGQTFKTRIQNSTNLPALIPSSSSSAYSSSSSNPPSPTTTTVNNDIPQRLPIIKPKPINYTPAKCPYQHSTPPQQSAVPLSPTMKAASAAAAAAASQSPSDVADTFLNSLSLSLSDSEDQQQPTSSTSFSNIQVDQQRPSFAKVSFMVHHKRSATMTADQKMFLTKNAHIKRPRNAWIHFRCHYGQALKSQDPTLRAEEISKRASRRWASLTEIEKKPWQDLAEQDKQAHKAAFPGYRYCPRRSNTPAMLAAKRAVQQEQEALY